MLNILKSEFLKLKKDAMFYTGTVISALVPILVIVKDRFLSSPPGAVMDWVMNCCLVDFLILSALSGFIVTNLVQREYQSGTLINVLTSAVSRASFVAAKLAVWFVWYAVLLVYIGSVTVLGCRLLYPAQFDAALARGVFAMFTEFGLASFVTFIPLLWVTVLQRKLFYPAVLTGIGFTGILLGGFTLSAEMLLPASILPWTAVSLVTVYQVENPYRIIGILSIAAAGIIGLLLALRAIRRQDQ